MRDDTKRASDARLEPAARDATPRQGSATPLPDRHATDGHGRSWRVRDIVAPSSGPQAVGRLIGRIFSCSTPGPIPELRHTWRRFVELGAVDPLDRLDLLQRVDH